MGLWSWVKHSFVKPSESDRASIFATESAPAPDPVRIQGGQLHEARFDAIARGLREGKYKNVVVLTGAGVSTAAGIPDFRSRAGMYELSRIFPEMPHSMAVFDAKFFRTNPLPFYYIVNKIMKEKKGGQPPSPTRVEGGGGGDDNTSGAATAATSPEDDALDPRLASYDPTVTHSFLRLLDEMGVLLRVYTQNVDCMEIAAGLDKSRLVQFHGTMADATCSVCGKQAPLRVVKSALLHRPFPDAEEPDFTVPHCERCMNPSGSGGVCATVKPNIVLFNERIPYGAIAQAAVDFPRADLLLCIGSTFQVFPFAGLAAKVDDCVPRLLLNLEKVASRDGAASDAMGTSQKLFAFDEPENVRDVFFGGPCDDSVRRLAAGAGWGEHLRALHEDRMLLPRPLTPSQQHRAPRGSSDSPAAAPTAAPRPRRPLNIDSLIAMQEGRW